MDFIKSNALLIIAVAAALVAIVYSLEAAIVLISGIASMLFGSNRQKDKEIAKKAEVLEAVEKEREEVKAELKRIDDNHSRQMEEILTNKQEEIDSWLDR
jgi:cell division protein FtsB